MPGFPENMHEENIQTPRRGPSSKVKVLTAPPLFGEQNPENKDGDQQSGLEKNWRHKESYAEDQRLCLLKDSLYTSHKLNLGFTTFLLIFLVCISKLLFIHNVQYDLIFVYFPRTLYVYSIPNQPLKTAAWFYSGLHSHAAAGWRKPIPGKRSALFLT